jgi:hypothetical protein
MGVRPVRRTAASAALALGALALVPIQPADAAERCVTKDEFHQVRRDMRIAKVHRIFDSDGRQVYDIGHFEKRSYTPCTDRRLGWVSVSFKDGHVSSKDAYWGSR